MKYWKIIARNISNHGWQLDCKADIGLGCDMWILKAKGPDGQRFVVESNELLNALVEAEKLSKRIKPSPP